MSTSAAVPAARQPIRDRVVARVGLDRFELTVLLALSALSMAILAGLAVKGRALTGADGVLASDQLQYFTWIREASHTFLVGNAYDFKPDTHSFLHPGFLISGLLHRVTGLSIPLTYLLWKPVVVVLAFTSALLYTRRMLTGVGARRAGLVLILFSVMPASALVAWTGWGGKPRQYTFDFISGEMWTGQYLWGYLMTGIAVFLMPLVLLAVERWRQEGRTRTLVYACIGALLVCWLQPWQGGALAIVVVGAEAIHSWKQGTRPRYALLLVGVAVAIPSVYYFALSIWDPAWELAGSSNAAGSQSSWNWPWWAIVLCLLPLAAPAALAYRLPAKDWQSVAIRLWPFAALLVYLQPTGTFPYHAFQGLAIPLSILAVQGVLSVWRRPDPRVVVAALVLMCVPGTIHKAEVAQNSVHVAGDPYFVFPGEQRAMDYLERDPRRGGVLAGPYAGHMLPYKTGREVWVGALSWTPDWDYRVGVADDLFVKGVSDARARQIVIRSGARFVFVDCRPGLRDLTAQLAPLTQSVRRFGCATVYVLRDRPDIATPSSSRG